MDNNNKIFWEIIVGALIIGVIVGLAIYYGYDNLANAIRYKSF